MSDFCHERFLPRATRRERHRARARRGTGRGTGSEHGQARTAGTATAVKTTDGRVRRAKGRGRRGAFRTPRPGKWSETPKFPSVWSVSGQRRRNSREIAGPMSAARPLIPHVASECGGIQSPLKPGHGNFGFSDHSAVRGVFPADEKRRSDAARAQARAARAGGRVVTRGRPACGAPAALCPATPSPSRGGRSRRPPGAAGRPRR